MGKTVVKTIQLVYESEATDKALPPNIELYSDGTVSFLLRAGTWNATTMEAPSGIYAKRNSQESVYVGTLSNCGLRKYKKNGIYGIIALGTPTNTSIDYCRQDLAMALLDCGLLTAQEAAAVAYNQSTTALDVSITNATIEANISTIDRVNSVGIIEQLPTVNLTAGQLLKVEADAALPVNVSNVTPIATSIDGVTAEFNIDTTKPLRVIQTVPTDKESENPSEVFATRRLTRKVTKGG